LTNSLLSRRKAYQKGLWGEWVAFFFLKIKGYRFLAHRLKTPFGEIDLLFRQGQTLVVVEVKVRSTLSQGLEALTGGARKRLKNAVLFFLTRHLEYGYLNIRFDVIVVRPWRFPKHFSHLFSFDT